MTDKTQSLMDAAYDRWQSPDNNWTKQDFWDQLSADERVAVFAGNMNQQVCNGGFSQWHDNKYATAETVGFLERLCKRLNTFATLSVLALLKDFRIFQAEMVKYEKVTWDRGDDDDAWDRLADMASVLDSAYYDLNDQFLADVEASL